MLHKKGSPAFENRKSGCEKLNFNKTTVRKCGLQEVKNTLFMPKAWAILFRR